MSRAATLVTGGSNGIGLAIARARQAAGDTVIVLDRAAPAEGAPFHHFFADLADAASLNVAIEGITTDYAVTRLVNCAGVALLSPLESLAAEDFRRTMEINVLAPALLARMAAVAMRAAGFGRILNISSRSALGRKLRTSYAASKGALISATRVWALELAEFGITVNAIGPGPIETDLYRKANPPDSEMTRNVIATVPVRRLGTPEDIAYAADFFLDARAGFVTGQTLFVCGGLTIGTAP